MKTKLPQAIGTIGEAKRLLKRLYDNGESFLNEGEGTALRLNLGACGLTEFKLSVV